MQTCLELARGPLFYACFAFMVLGLLRHIAITVYEIGRALHRAGDKTVPWDKLAEATFRWLFPVDKLQERTLYGLTSFVFHIAIIVTPLFLAAHVNLMARGIGFGWPTISSHIADGLTLAAIITAFMLILPARHLQGRRADGPLPRLCAARPHHAAVLLGLSWRCTRSIARSRTTR